MAHNSKRWITDYRGRIKRSRHRTKDDFYGNLKWWDYRTDKHSWNDRKARYCPQCRYVQKQLPANDYLPDRTYLCYPCERKYEVKRTMWRNVPGWKARYSFTVRQCRKDYRNYVRRMMQQERYDEIEPRRRDWLD